MLYVLYNVVYKYDTYVFYVSSEKNHRGGLTHLNPSRTLYNNCNVYTDVQYIKYLRPTQFVV